MAKNGADKAGERLLAQNRKARHDYDIIETYEAGMVLTGTEIKSVRRAHITIGDGFARVRDGEVWLSGVTIAHFEEGNLNNHEEVRDRKLLLHKRQIAAITRALGDAGTTLIPLRVYIKNGVAKVLMGLARGKHAYDKRDSLRRRDIDRDVKRQLKNYR